VRVVILACLLRVSNLIPMAGKSDNIGRGAFQF